MTSFVDATHAITSGQRLASSRAALVPNARALEARLLFLIMAAFLAAGIALALRALSAVTAFQWT